MELKIPEDNWSIENNKRRLKLLITNLNFGNDRKIKLAIFKCKSNYDDEYMNYEPLVILVDEEFNEIDHNINASHLVPSYDEESYYYELYSEMVDIEDFTLKF